MQLENHPADFLLQMTSLLDGHGIWLLRKRLSDLGEVAVVVVFIANLEQRNVLRAAAVQLFEVLFAKPERHRG